jgi:hypothetical protein
MKSISDEEIQSKDEISRVKESIRQNKNASSFFFKSTFSSEELELITEMNIEELKGAELCIQYIKQKIKHVKRFSREVNPEIKRVAIVCSAIAQSQPISKLNLDRGGQLITRERRR